MRSTDGAIHCIKPAAIAAVFFVAICFALPALCFALPPGETVPGELLRSTIDQAKDLVVNKKGKVPEKILKTELEQVVFPLFDLEKMSKLSLGANWNKANAEQQKEYVKLFSDLFSRTYYKRIVDGIDSSDIEIREEKLKGKKAIVKTIVSLDTGDSSVDYRMFEKDGVWKVYDVIIENVGLVSNYRSEFTSIVRKDKIEGLLDLLRKKQADGEPA